MVSTGAWRIAEIHSVSDLSVGGKIEMQTNFFPVANAATQERPSGPIPGVASNREQRTLDGLFAP